MWQNLVSGILGLWLVLVVFLDFSSTMTRFFLVLAGVAVAFFSFWALKLVKQARAKSSESEISFSPSREKNESATSGQFPPSENKNENLK